MNIEEMITKATLIFIIKNYSVNTWGVWGFGFVSKEKGVMDRQDTKNIPQVSSPFFKALTTRARCSQNEFVLGFSVEH